MKEHEKRIREALEAVPLPHEWAVCQDPPNSYWFKGTTIGASDPGDARRVADTCVLSPDAERFATFIAACNPAAIRALLADLDAVRGLLLRIRQQDYLDDTYRARIDAALKGATA